jgi:transposase InsO family protein
VDAAVTSVAMAALVADGLLAGLSLDKVIVQLPARRRIGVTTYAAYARAADLGNGIALYAAAGADAAALTLPAFAVAASRGAPAAVTGLLAAAALLSLVHSAKTAACGRLSVNQSMGRPGSALDHAVMESWHSTLEWELRRVEHFAAKAQARAKVAAWIDDYNRRRRHSSLGMKSPVDYEQALAAGEAA